MSVLARILLMMVFFTAATAAEAREVKWYLFDRFQVGNKTYYVSAESTLPVPDYLYFEKALDSHVVGPVKGRFQLEGSDGEGYVDPRPEGEALFAVAQSQASSLIRPSRAHANVTQDFWDSYMKVSPYEDERSIMTTLWEEVEPWRLRVVTTLLMSYQTPNSPVPLETLFGKKLEQNFKFGPIGPIYPFRVRLLDKGEEYKEFSDEPFPTSPDSVAPEDKNYKEFSELHAWGGLWIEFAALSSVHPCGFDFLMQWIERQHLTLLPVRFPVNNIWMPVFATGFANFANIGMEPFYGKRHLKLPKVQTTQRIWDIYEYDRATAFNLHKRVSNPELNLWIDAWNRQHAARQYNIINTSFAGRGAWNDGCLYRLLRSARRQRPARQN